MNTRSNEVETALQVVKDAAQNAMMENGIKQETVADAIGLTQSSVSKMCNYTGEQHFAIGHLPALYADKHTRIVALSILQSVGGLMGLEFDERVAPEQLDGSIDDNLLNIDVLQGKIIQLRGGDMRKVASICQELKIQISIIELEAQNKLKGK